MKLIAFALFAVYANWFCCPVVVPLPSQLFVGGMENERSGQIKSNMHSIRRGVINSAANEQFDVICNRIDCEKYYYRWKFQVQLSSIACN